LPVRLKKFIGMIALIALVVLYALISTAFAVAVLADKSAWTHLAFYLVSGLMWILPAMWIIKWMETSKRRESE